MVFKMEDALTVFKNHFIAHNMTTT